MSEDAKKMMIIEGMKSLRIIEKKMQQNTADIQRYASQVSTEKPLFETEEKQRKEIKQMIQANSDHMKNYLNLKSRIEYTNLMTKVQMKDSEYTISELLVIQRKLATMMFQTYNALNDTEGKGRLGYANAPQGSETPHVVRYYKEEDKREQQRKWQDLMNDITTRLEVINATTELLDLPSMS